MNFGEDTCQSITVPPCPSYQELQLKKCSCSHQKTIDPNMLQIPALVIPFRTSLIYWHTQPFSDHSYKHSNMLLPPLTPQSFSGSQLIFLCPLKQKFSKEVSKITAFPFPTIYSLIIPNKSG